MLIGCPKETAADERRVALTPESALQLQSWAMNALLRQMPEKTPDLLMPPSGRWC